MFQKKNLFLVILASIIVTPLLVFLVSFFLIGIRFIGTEKIRIEDETIKYNNSSYVEDDSLALYFKYYDYKDMDVIGYHRREIFNLGFIECDDFRVSPSFGDGLIFSKEWPISLSKKDGKEALVYLKEGLNYSDIPVSFYGLSKYSGKEDDPDKTLNITLNLDKVFSDKSRNLNKANLGVLYGKVSDDVYIEFLLANDKNGQMIYSVSGLKYWYNVPVELKSRISELLK